MKVEEVHLSVRRRSGPDIALATEIIVLVVQLKLHAGQR